jgi:hypothetical protein
MRHAFTSFLDRLNDRRPGPLSLERAFRVHGVTLTAPGSWSGIRDEDGDVVIAVRRAKVRSTADGFSCLLWSPLDERRSDCSDEPHMEERLAHCRLAARAGGAEGLLVEGMADEVHLGSIVTMHVQKRQNQYWATWGFAARFASRPRAFSWAGAGMPVMAAA